MGATIVQSMDALALVKEKHRVILIENEVHADEVVGKLGFLTFNWTLFL